MIRIISVIVVPLVILLHIDQAYSQHLRLITATRQDWSGGVEGMMGTNYYLEFSSKKGPAFLTPDSIWIGKTGYKLNVSVNRLSGNTNTVVSTSGRNTLWKMYLAKDRSDPRLTGQPGAGNPVENQSTGERQPVPAYNGEALLIFHAEGKRCCLVISKFKGLEALAYP